MAVIYGVERNLIQCAQMDLLMSMVNVVYIFKWLLLVHR